MLRRYEIRRRNSICEGGGGIQINGRLYDTITIVDITTMAVIFDGLDISNIYLLSIPDITFDDMESFVDVVEMQIPLVVFKKMYNIGMLVNVGLWIKITLLESTC